MEIVNTDAFSISGSRKWSIALRVEGLVFGFATPSDELGVSMKFASLANSVSLELNIWDGTGFNEANLRGIL